MVNMLQMPQSPDGRVIVPFGKVVVPSAASSRRMRLSATEQQVVLQHSLERIERGPTVAERALARETRKGPKRAARRLSVSEQIYVSYHEVRKSRSPPRKVLPGEEVDEWVQGALDMHRGSDSLGGEVEVKSSAELLLPAGGVDAGEGGQQEGGRGGGGNREAEAAAEGGEKEAGLEGQRKGQGKEEGKGEGDVARSCSDDADASTAQGGRQKGYHSVGGQKISMADAEVRPAQQHHDSDTWGTQSCMSIVSIFGSGPDWEDARACRLR